MVPILRNAVVVCLPVIFAVAFVPPSAAQEKSPKLDFNGVPLPDGALARHGTVRMWHFSPITQLAFTPDGNGLLSIDKELAFYKWDLTTGKELWQFDRKHLPMPLTFRHQSLEAARFVIDGQLIVFKTFGESKVKFMASHSGDGKVLAVADPKANAVIVLNSTTGKQICKIPLKWDAQVLTVSPSGKLLAILETTPRRDEAALRIWDLVKGKEAPAPKLSGPRHYMNSLVFSADEKQLAGISQHSVAVWDLVTNKRMANYDHNDNIYDVAFSQDGRLLASASYDGSVRVWDKTSEEEIKKLAPADTYFSTVAFTPDGKQVVAGDGKGNLHLWNLTTGIDKILKGHTAGIVCLAVSPNGAKIASADERGGLRLWDVLTGDVKQIVKVAERLKGMGVNNGGHSLVLWTAAGPIRHVDTLTGVDLLEAHGPPKESGSVKLTADGQIAAWFDRKNKSITLWDAATGAELRQLPIGLNDASILTFSRDGQWVATTESGRGVEIIQGGNIQFQQIGGAGGFQQIGGQSENTGTVRVWNTTTGKQIRSFAKISPDTAVFSPDGKLLALLTDMDELCLFEMASGKERCRLRTLCYNADAALAFSPNGRHLVTTADNALCLWDLTKGKPLRGFYGHDGMVLAVAFAPKGDIIASGGRDGTVRLWKVDTGEELRCFSGHQGGIERL
ncbi:MAG TPA: WD40 repeat domain-containing protein, partial [Gemmataceae bacterium]|nr:WD40 repeat domain-containing protein [Gemmataceae bacterium]